MEWVMDDGKVEEWVNGILSEQVLEWDERHN
jgi:hypothetical protein